MPTWNESAPHEVIASPATIYLAPALTARPDIAVYPLPAPSGAWTLLGKDGDLNYKEDGVTIAQPQTIVKWRPLGDTGPRKAFRTEEDTSVRVIVADLTLEAWRVALNQNTVGLTAAGGSTAGHKKVGLSRGPNVRMVALLVRFPSPYGAGLFSQLWIPRAINEGASEFQFKKDDPAGLALDFSAMVWEDAESEEERLGIVEAQTTVPSS